MGKNTIMNFNIEEFFFSFKNVCSYTNYIIEMTHYSFLIHFFKKKYISMCIWYYSTLSPLRETKKSSRNKSRALYIKCQKHYKLCNS